MFNIPLDDPDFIATLEAQSANGRGAFCLGRPTKTSPSQPRVLPERFRTLAEAKARAAGGYLFVGFDHRATT
jgi:hypothetical protein